MRSLATALMAFATTGLLTVAGCNALLDIDHIDFGNSQGGAGAAAGSGGTGTGGDGATTTTTTTGGGGSGAEGGDGGGGGAPAENCTNGVDDNDDTLVDCADPLCDSYTCVAQTLPPFWSGPVVLYVGTSAPTCSGAWPTLSVTAGSGTLSAPPATCTSCSCGSPQAVTCPIGSTSFWTGNSCNGSATLTQTPSAPNTCFAVTNAVVGYLSAEGNPSTATGGSCTATGGSATIPTASYTDDVVICEGATSGEGCTGAEACMPPGGTGFEPGVCIYRDGNRSCDAPFTVKHTIHTTIDDSRGCSTCLCGAPSGVSCGGTTSLYQGATNSTCTGSPVTVSHTGTCTTVAAAGSMSYASGSPSGGGCAATGGAPSGSAAPSGQVTVCCTP